MRVWSSFASLLFALLPGMAWAQPTPSDQPAPQIKMDFAIGKRMTEDLDKTEGRIEDQEIIGFLQGIQNRLATATNTSPIEIRLTPPAELYATLLPNRVLYLSAGMAARADNEGEIAGLLAHELAHAEAGWRAAPPGQIKAWAPCVLGRDASSDGFREREQDATRAAVGYLKAVRFDPAAELDLLSKIAYANPRWGKAIVADDLLDLRVQVEAEIPPADGYRLDSSEFARIHKKLVAALPRGRGLAGRSSAASTPP